MSDLDEDDILLWSERQAELLRRRAAGELVNDAEIDWSNVAEEIEDVGKSEIRSVRSHILMALLHDLKAEAWPRSRDVPHWRAEARMHRGQGRGGEGSSRSGRRLSTWRPGSNNRRYALWVQIVRLSRVYASAAVTLEGRTFGAMVAVRCPS